MPEALHQPIHDDKGRDNLGDLREGATDNQPDKQVAAETEDAGPTSAQLVDEEYPDEDAGQGHQGEDELPYGHRLEGLAWHQRVDNSRRHNAVREIDEVVDEERAPCAQEADPVSLEDKPEWDPDRLCRLEVGPLEKLRVLHSQAEHEDEEWKDDRDCVDRDVCLGKVVVRCNQGHQVHEHTDRPTPAGDECCRADKNRAARLWLVILHPLASSLSAQVSTTMARSPFAHS